MKITVLSGANHGDEISREMLKMVSETLAQHELTIFNLNELKIDACLGCFGCWMKTPGVCVIDDAGRDVAKAVVQSDLVITLSPVTFGGYSYEFKKALDRIIPIISPFFTKIKGETHHRRRYDRYPSWISIGLMDGEDEEAAASFGKLEERRVMHFYCPAHTYRVLQHSTDGFLTHFEELLKKVGVA